MATIRRRIIIDHNDDGTAIVKQIQAKNENEANDKTVQAYIDSGRIWEFLGKADKAKAKTKTLFKPYVESWMETFKRPTLKPKTFHTYVGYLHSHLYPAFGDRYIEDITAQDIQKFMNDREHLARKSINSYCRLLEQILDAAMEDKLIEENPAKSKRLANPSDKSKPREALSETHYREIVQSIMKLENCPEKLFLASLTFTGIRKNEALGLRWDDFNLTADEPYFDIVRGVTHVGNPPIIGKPKTKSGERRTYFGDNFRAILLAMQGEGFLFGREKPLSLKEYNTLWKHANMKIDLHGATPHVLRHTFLTTAAAENIDPKTLQGMAGHADHQITMNTYVHKKDENLAKAGQMMDALLGDYAKAG